MQHIHLKPEAISRMKTLSVSIYNRWLFGSAFTMLQYVGADHGGPPHAVLAGLSFQLFTMFLFVLAALDFAIRVLRRYRAHGDQVLDRTESVVAIRKSKYFQPFLCALSVATICIFIRCVFRVVELSSGWTGPLTRNQTLFIVFEGLMIFVASAALAVFNPCLCLKGLPADTDQTRPRHVLNAIPRSGKPLSSFMPPSDV